MLVASAPMQPSRSWTLPALVAVALLVGCGRKATEADCQLIVDQTVAVKLKEKNVTDPAAVTKMPEYQKRVTDAGAEKVLTEINKQVADWRTANNK